MRTVEEVLNNNAQAWNCETGEYESEWVVRHDDAEEAMKEYGKELAIAFADWIKSDCWLEHHDGSNIIAYDTNKDEEVTDLFEEFLKTLK